MIAKMNPEKSKEDTENSEPVGGLKKEEGPAVKGNGTDDDGDGDEDGDGDGDEDGDKQPGAGQEEIKIYDPSEFMKSFYKSHVDYPLYGGGNTTKALIIKYLQENADDLKKLNSKTTWIIPHNSVTTYEAAAIDDYFLGKKGGDKTVVVVLSAFFLPKPPSTTPVQKQPKTDINRYKADPRILVCSIPAPVKGKAGDHTYYDDAFNQVKAFIDHYNQEVVSAERGISKIERIAISYPPALYEKLLDSKPQKKKAGVKKAESSVKTKTKKPISKKAAEKSTSKASTQKATIKNLDESYDTSDDGSEDGSDTDSVDGIVDDDEDSVTNDVWLKALEKTLSDFSLILMCDKDTPWQAPSGVKEYFKENKTVTGKFPDCIDINNSSKPQDSEVEEEDEDDEDRVDTIKISGVPGTLFICDRQVGKRVGNNNEQSTTGGAFGSWVPMHYTAAMVKPDLYSNASEINDLIDVIYVNKQKKQ
jgi:hypothetical protein